MAKRKKRVVLKFPKDIYPEIALRRACRELDLLKNIRYRQDADFHIVSLPRCAPSVFGDRTPHEFANKVLAITKECL